MLAKMLRFGPNKMYATTLEVELQSPLLLFIVHLCFQYVRHDLRKCIFWQLFSRKEKGEDGV